MSLTVDGVWKSGVWSTTVWADDVWREGERVVEPELTTSGVVPEKQFIDPDEETIILSALAFLNTVV